MSGNSYFEITKSGKLLLQGKQLSADYFVKRSCKYNKSDYLVHEVNTWMFDGKETVTTTKYTLDKKKTIASTSTDEKGKKEKASQVTYKKGRLTEIIYSDSTGKYDGKDNYLYEHNVLTIVRKDRENKVVQKNILDEMGRTSKVFFLYDEREIEYRYEGNGVMPTQIKALESDKLSERTVYIYNEKLNLIKQEVYDHNNMMYDSHRFEYEYDDQGNWIKQRIYSPSGLRYITEREIEYYK